MNTNYDLLRKKEELKELLWAEIFTQDDYWRKELSPQDKEILKELLEEMNFNSEKDS